MGTAERTLPIAGDEAGLDAPWRGTAIGRYLVVERLGAGGVGEVFAAYDPQLDRRVALKLLRGRVGGPQATAASEQDWRTLLREAQALARLSDPHVVVVHDVGVFEGRTFLAMELVDGVDLELWLRREPADWRTILRVMIDAGAGLAAAHGAGVVHRDFKPANVLVGRDGRVKVGDFGLARRHDDDAATRRRPLAHRAGDSDATTDAAGVAPGTPYYMAPELFVGGEANVGTDVYAFCVALYEALAGRRPHQGETMAALVAAKHAPLAAMGHRSLPRGVIAAIERGLAVEPARRWPDMDGLLAVLRRAIAPRRWPLAVGVTSIAALVSGWSLARADAPGCDGGARHLAEIWDQGRADAIATRLRASDRPFAADVARDVVDTADAFASRWSASHREVCERGRHDEQSDAALDARMACLDDARLALAGVLDGLAAGGDAALARASAAIHGLPAPEPCTSRMPSELPPSDPELRARVKRAQAALELGDVAGADDLATAIADEATRVGDPRSAIDAARVRGLAEAALGRIDDAERTLTAAVFEAQAVDAREQQIAIAISLAILLTNETARYPEAARWVDYARAELAHGGALERLRGRVLAVAAGVAMAQDDLEAGIAGYASTLAWQAEHDVDPLERASTLASHGVALRNARRFDEAIAQARAAIDERTSVLGPDHPHVAMATAELGRTLADAGRRDEAAAVLDRAAAILDRSLGSQDAALADVAIDVAANERVRGHLDAAAEAAARAVDILEGRDGGGSHALFVALDELASAEDLRGEHVRALGIYRRALELGERLELAPGDLASVRINLGSSLLDAGELDEAVATLGVALELLADDPVRVDVRALGWLGLGEAEARRGRVAEARDALAQVESLLPGIGDPELDRRAVALAAVLRAHAGRPGLAPAAATTPAAP